MDKTASLISSTRRTERLGAAGFTLIEVMAASSLSGIVLAGVISVMLLIGGSSIKVSEYAELENQARVALELFGREARMARSVGGTLSSTSVVFSIPASDTSSAYSVTYAFDATAQTFTRTDTITGTPTVLISGVRQIPGKDPFQYYSYIAGNYADTTSDPPPNQIDVADGNPVAVKQIAINFLAQRTSVMVTAATNKVFSARFVLRNK